MSSDPEIAPRLLSYLRDSFDVPALAYAEAPARLSGGFETSIFRFRLAGTPPGLSAPLILRLLRPFRDPVQVRIEGTVHNALAALGYPAPRVAVMEPDVGVLGGAFLVMERAEGQPLAAGFDGLIAGGGVGGTLRLLLGARRMVEHVATVWADSQADLHALPVEPILAAIEAAGLPLDVVTFEGRLASLGRAIENSGQTGLLPGQAWLMANRPPAPSVLSVCHGDFHPLNMLTADGRITGVIDWGHVMIGDAALDVGGTIANVMTVPIGTPLLLRPLARGLVRYVLARYRRAYAHRRRLDARAVRYYEVFRCLGHLVAASRGRGQSGPAAGAHHSAAAVRLLVGRIRAVCGVRVTLAD